jgi:pimeloyl-ACP methyl ester carboxylesterase
MTTEQDPGSNATFTRRGIASLIVAGASALSLPAAAAGAAGSRSVRMLPAGVALQVRYRTRQVDGLNIFYREAGPPGAPVILLLHGFPTSSHMFRDIIPRLSGRYRVIAPDYPGYGFSDAPPADKFRYSFDRLASVMDAFVRSLGITRFVLYAQDFGGPVGFRMAAMHPERITGLVIQNAVAHEEGLSAALKEARPFWERRTPETEAPMRAFLKPETTRYQYLAGARDPSAISPDAWLHAQALLDRPGSAEIQLSLLHDYGSNLRRYPEWQAYFRRHRPPMLVAWGKNDPFFTVAGAEAYRRDNPAAEVHLLDGGHFALEEFAPEISALMLSFVDRITGR